MNAILIKLQAVDATTFDEDMWSPYLEALTHMQMVIDGANAELDGTFAAEKVENSALVALGLEGVLVTTSALAGLCTCAATAYCLTELTKEQGAGLLGEYSGAMTMTTAVGGKLVLTYGDDVLGVVENCGRGFRLRRQMVRQDILMTRWGSLQRQG